MIKKEGLKLAAFGTIVICFALAGLSALVHDYLHSSRKGKVPSKDDLQLGLLLLCVLGIGVGILMGAFQDVGALVEKLSVQLRRNRQQTQLPRFSRNIYITIQSVAIGVVIWFIGISGHGLIQRCVAYSRASKDTMRPGPVRGMWVPS
jgi:hypothetical protein